MESRPAADAGRARPMAQRSAGILSMPDRIVALQDRVG